MIPALTDIPMPLGNPLEEKNSHHIMTKVKLQLLQGPERGYNWEM
jgi:hypothetical protein